MVAAHKKFPMPDKKGYLPVLVGAAKTISRGLSIKETTRAKIFQQRIQIIMNLLQFIGLGRI